MQLYLLSAGASLLVGIVYSLPGVRSPGPPIIALIGLLGILAGEQIVPMAKRMMAGEPITVSWLMSGCVPHHFGHLSGHGKGPAVTPELVIRHARITTLDRANPEASAVAIADGRFIAVGSEAEAMPLAGPATRVIDAGGRRAIPGLIDSHIHVIRGGLNDLLELRWDGVDTLADAMAMLRATVARTPPPRWVRVVGGFTEYQFAEKRLPTLDELNDAGPDTPVFILHLYDRALLNRAALRAAGYTKDTPDPPGGMIERDAAGNPTGLLLARPNAMILDATLAKGPKMPPDQQRTSTRWFMRELNRLGVTSAIDAGGGFQNWPDDYAVIRDLHRRGC